MGASSSLESDNYVSSAMTTFSDEKPLAFEDTFWDDFLSVRYRNYVDRSGSMCLDEAEMKFRRNYASSQNMCTLIELICRRIGTPIATYDTSIKASNAFYLIRHFLFKMCTAEKESIIQTLAEASPQIMGSWNRYLKRNNIDVLIDGLYRSLLYYKDKNQMVHAFHADCASTLLTTFLIPTWDNFPHQPLFPMTCLLTKSSSSAATFVKNLLTHYLKHHLHIYPEDEVPIKEAAYLEYIDVYRENDLLGETSLWLILLLAHRPETLNEVNVFNQVLSTFVNDDSFSETDDGMVEGKNCETPNKTMNNGELEQVIISNGDNLDLLTEIVVEANDLSMQSLNLRNNENVLMANKLKENGSYEEHDGEKAKVHRQRSVSLPSNLEIEVHSKSPKRKVKQQTEPLPMPSLTYRDYESEESPNGIFKINFSDVYTAVCSTIDYDGSLLLGYTIILRNKSMRTYFQRRNDIDVMVSSLMRRLYVTDGQVNSFPVYLSLCSMLMLSEDQHFCEGLHDFPGTDISWFRDRIVYDISLGSIVIVVLLRLLSINLSKIRDDFINETVLAILSNMASSFKKLHPYACQQLVTSFEVMGRRSARLQSDDKHKDDSSDSQNDSLQPEDKEHYLTVLKENMRAILQIIEACVVVRLADNPNLIYTILHKESMFKQFQDIDPFKESLTNLATVWEFYNERLSKREDQLSEQDVLEEINNCQHPFVDMFPKVVEDLQYQYIEDKSCPGFFLPYVCYIINTYTKLHTTSEIMPSNVHQHQ